MMTSEPKSLFVWIWLPGQNVPVVAGQVVRNEDTAVIHFGYARSYRKNPNAIPIFTGVVAWITDISERALPETDFMRYARSRGGQVRSYG
jgi:hypothetical protein